LISSAVRKAPQTLRRLTSIISCTDRRKALAIPETTTPDTLATIDDLTARLVKQYPRIEFYTHAIRRDVLTASTPSPGRENRRLCSSVFFKSPPVPAT